MATILIVEDRPIDRKLLTTVLSSGGHAVVQAADGEEALRLVRHAAAELVISDILMPTVDGYEFVRRLRELPDVGSIPVLFYTATYHEREARALAERCGVTAILTKPSSPEVILDTVARVLTSGHAASPPVAEFPQFSREHLRVVSTTLAAKVTEVEAGRQRISAIVDVAQQIAAERDPEALLRHVCGAARDVTLARLAVIGLVSEDGSAVRRLIASGVDEAALDQIPPPSTRGAVLRAIIDGREIIRRQNEDGRPEALGLPVGHPAVHSFLGVPIASSSRVYGWIGLKNKLGAEEFSEADAEVAATLGTHAGVAYENAHLYDVLRRHVAALEQEVAERRHAEERLRANEERTRFALAAARIGLWESDIRSGQLTWSETMAPLFGLPPQEAPLTHDAFLQLVHADDRHVLAEALQKTITQGHELAVEFRAIWRDGSEHWIDARARVVADADGRPERVLGIGIDVGERKLLEEQFRQAQKMEAVGQLAGGVAHDFNNLLTAILGYGALLTDALAPLDPRRADVAEIVRAAERAAGLTRQLLAFSRKQVLQPTVLDLNTLVKGMTEMLRRLIGEDIELSTTLTPELARVRADAGQIEQVVMNLAVNARDAMPAGGRLTIETANVELDVAYAMQHVTVRAGSYVMLAVSDSGTGMDEQTRRRLFEPFFTTKERGKGTGLGLATVYGIVKQSGGYIWVYSEPGDGATFKVYLPRAEGEAEPAPIRRPARVTSGSESILVVEDEEAVRFLCRVVLERAGYRVWDAQDASGAETVFRDHGQDIELLITDVVLPGSTGPALLASLGVSRPDLKVLYMSGYTDDAIVRHGRLEPGVAFLQKPFTGDRLAQKVREVLDS